MDDTIKEQITKELGVEPVLVNSKLLSAQNRERLYWTNIPVGETPKEKGIIVNKILESDVDDKYFVHDENITYTQSVDKIRRMNPYQIAYYANGGQGQRVYSVFGKGVTQTANGGGRGAKTGLYYVGENRVRRLTPLESERMQTLPDNYTDCDISDNNRYKAIGNGWTVDIIAHFFTGLRNVKPKTPTDDTDKDLEGEDAFKDGVDVLSVFDGMSCGMLAMLDAGQKVNNYYAYEIDEPAVQTSLYNFPQISQQGDVFEADFTEYEGIDYLVGGSPCTYWSIAQSPDKRETTASGLGWDLFCQYVRALKEAKPKFFIYENNKSMARDIYESISKTFGFEPIMINSALVSAQNRQRYYWVGKRNEDGTYSKVDVQQPKDRGILLKDIINKPQRDLTNNEKAYCLTARYEGAAPYNTIERKQRTMVAEPITCRCRGRKDKNGNGYAKYECRNDHKSNTLDTNTTNGSMVAEPVAVSFVGDRDKRKIGTMDKAYCVATSPCSDSLKGIAEPICERIPKYGKDDKSRPVIAGYSRRGEGEGCLKRDAFPDNPDKQVNDYVVEPVNITKEGKTHTLKAQYFCNGTANFITNEGFNASGVAEPLCLNARTNGVQPSVCDRIYDPQGKATAVTSGWHTQISEPVDHKLKKIGILPRKDGRVIDNQGTRIYSTEGKGQTLCAGEGGLGVHTGLYAVPVEYKDDIPVKAVSVTDGKEHTVYEVKDKKITIKGKQYDIKLEDGYYIIRKLTVEECKELQTVPQWYDFSCTSISQAYKMLGNGWTVKVISHLIQATID